jgi:rod shape-determining protein MreC
VHDKKQIRRRRAVLALLVGVSLILLTAYFGESPSSPLHSVQRGIVQVLSPIQEGASKALKPVRDIAGWFSSTFHAKSERDQLQKEVAALRAKNAKLQQALIENAQLTKQVGLDNSIGIDALQPVAAHVISRDPTLWYATIEIDKGTADGVRKDDPVVGDGALVGKVSTVAPNVSVVTLVTDHSFAVSAEVQDQAGDTGVLVPAVGNPNQLLLQYLPPQAQISSGQQVVTAGFKSGPLESLYPAGIPIGQVSDANQNDLINNRQVKVTPSADLRHLDFVQVLTQPQGGTRRVQLPSKSGP